MEKKIANGYGGGSGSGVVLPHAKEAMTTADATATEAP